jgi:hypothetical protein
MQSTPWTIWICGISRHCYDVKLPWIPKAKRSKIYDTKSKEPCRHACKARETCFSRFLGRKLTTEKILKSFCFFWQEFVHSQGKMIILIVRRFKI